MVTQGVLRQIFHIQGLQPLTSAQQQQQTNNEQEGVVGDLGN